MMDSLSYVDEGMLNSFTRHKLSKLQSGFLEPVDPSDAIRTTCRLAQLLLLSNHLDHAHALLCALYKHVDAIFPPAKAKAGVGVGVPRIQQHAEEVIPPSQAVEYFWTVHNSTHARPANSGTSASEQKIAGAQWGKYRECCRTGWMLEHCNLPEPDHPHVWRETEEPALLAMCCRLLAKNKMRADYKNRAQGAYPPLEQTVEALAAAKKLFALHEAPRVDREVNRAYGDRSAPKRYSELLYRRLGIELAIRAGELDTAVWFLSDGLVRDGFVNGGTLENYLFIPGIYDVLPLLAKRGKDRNPFYIEAKDASTMVAEISRIIEVRAVQGRQWSLAPEKVGWKELLHRLAEGAWKVNKEEYLLTGINSAEEILFQPASEEEIRAAEEKVGPLPPDFREMVGIANGFQGGNHLFGGGICGITNISPSHSGDLDLELELGLELGNIGIDTLNLDPDTNDLDLDPVEIQAGYEECDGFQHYYIPPAMWKKVCRGRRGEKKEDEEVKDADDGEYVYWHRAAWAVGGYGPWKSIRDWVASCVETVEEMVERGEKIGDDG